MLVSYHGRQPVERFWYLKKSELFENLTASEYHRLEAQAVVRRFARKQVVYFPSDPGSTVLLLFEGRIKIKTITPEGKEAILAFIEPGEMFGELSLVDPGKRGEFAESALASLVCAIPRETMLEVMSAHPETALRVTKIMGLKQRRIENRVKNMLFRSFRERVVFLLLELAERYGKPTGRQIQIGLKLSHQEIASLIGATRETVTILLGELQNDGHIRVQRRLITVLDPGRLEQSVN
jgi:CRP-like cAMP-binding protein